MARFRVVGSRHNSELLSLKPHDKVPSKEIAILYACSYVKWVNETKRERDKVKKSPALDPSLLYQWMIFLSHWHGYIINHATEVEADFHLFLEVAADGYLTRSEMMAASSVKHRERWASWFDGLLVIITAYTLFPYNNRVVEWAILLITMLEQKRWMHPRS